MDNECIITSMLLVDDFKMSKYYSKYKNVHAKLMLHLHENSIEHKSI